MHHALSYSPQLRDKLNGTVAGELLSNAVQVLRSAEQGLEERRAREAEREEQEEVRLVRMAWKVA